jgi:hypothetical protein
LNRHQSREKDEEGKRSAEIYANLLALGINIDLVRECGANIFELRDFHDRIIALLDSSQPNTQTVAV